MRPQDAKRISTELGEWETLVTAPRCTARKRESVTTSAQSGKLRQQTITSSLPLSSTAPKHAHPPNCSPPPAHRRSKHCTTEREDEAPGPNKNTKWQLVDVTRDTSASELVLEKMNQSKAKLVLERHSFCDNHVISDVKRVISRPPM